MLTPGTLIPHRCRIVRLMGQSGFGAVYEALGRVPQLPCRPQAVHARQRPITQRQETRKLGRVKVRVGPQPWLRTPPAASMAREQAQA